MTTIRLYHNPRCSKSRQALELLLQQEVDVEIIDYLKTPPTEDELDALLGMLGIGPRELMRQKEAEYLELHLDDITLEHKHLVRVMTQHPRLIERPIAITGQRAVIGRPAERVLTLLG
jgi:arsenate reductase